jgi:hypothetical protein
MDAVAGVFPVDRRRVKAPADLAWACVLVLEAAVPALADPDPELGAARPLVPRAARAAWPGSGRRPPSGTAAWKGPSRPTRTRSSSTWPRSPSRTGTTARCTAGSSSASPGAARCPASRSPSASRNKCLVYLIYAHFTWFVLLAAKCRNCRPQMIDSGTTKCCVKLA